MDAVTPCFSDWRHSRRRNAGLRKKKNGVGLGRRRGSSRKPRSPLASIVTARIKRREYEEAARYPSQPNRLTVHATKRKKTGNCQVRSGPKDRRDYFNHSAAFIVRPKSSSENVSRTKEIKTGKKSGKASAGASTSGRRIMRHRKPTQRFCE